MVEINAKLIDVNVHPTKKIIKFAEERKIYKSVFSALSSVLEESFLAPEIKMEDEKLEIPFKEIREKESKDSFVKEKTDFQYSAKVQKKIFTSEKMLKDKVVKEKIPEIVVIGQFANTYIIGKTFEDEEEKNLVIIDQHAAHEKIIYEKLIYKFKKLNSK